jgi:purine nucleosidase
LAIALRCPFPGSNSPTHRFNLELLIASVRPLLLDTDIGYDVDDLYTLVMLAKSAEIELRGITTVHGNSSVRAKIARYVCQLLGRESIPVIPGETSPLVSRATSWDEPDTKGFPDLDAVSVNTETSAPDFLVKAAAEKRLEILAIAPLTNLALAVQNSPAFVSNVERIYLMGGAFWLPYLEHNIQVDPEAAGIVFDSGIPITAVGLDVTLQVEITEPELLRLSGLPNGLGTLLDQQTRLWWERLERQRCHLHDPLTAMAILHRELFEFETGVVKIEATGHTRFHPEAGGPVEVARTVQAAAALELILQAIEAA